MARDILPSGASKFSTAEDIQALSQRNMQSFMKTLSNKTVQKSVEALSKIDKDEWENIATTAISLKSIVDAGGLGDVFGSMIDNITESVSLKMEELMSPLTNEVTTAINDLLNPFILWLTPFINGINGFVAENKAGAGVGGIIGGVAGLFLPGGPIVGAIVGAIIGSLFEDYYSGGTAGEPGVEWDNTKAQYDKWLLFNPMGSKEDYLKYLLGDANTYLPGQDDYRSGR